MDTGHLLRGAAIACLALAIGLSALALRHGEPLEPAPTLVARGNTAAGDADLHARLLACSALGEAASSDPDCRAAWAAKRRHFLGLDRDGTASPSPVPSET